MKKLFTVLLAVAMIFAFATVVLAAEFVGKIEKTDKGFAIKGDKDTLTIAGKVDVSKLVGKKVKATGDIKDKTITVTKVEEVK
jgi:membrane protein implicated in regulation of membrane protease activity